MVPQRFTRKTYAEHSVPDNLPAIAVQVDRSSSQSAIIMWLVHWRSREKRRERQPINTHQVVRACPSCSHSLLSGGRPGFASRGDMRENVPHPHCFARFHSVLRISFVQLLWSPTAEGFPEVLVLVLCIVMQLWAWRFTSRSYAAPQSKGNTDRRR